MPFGSLDSALQRFPKYRATIAEVLRAVAINTAFVSFEQLLTLWCVYEARALGGVKALRSHQGFRNKHRQTLKRIASALCDAGLLQKKAEIIVCPLKDSPKGGPLRAPSSPLCIWRPPSSYSRLDELRPFVHESSFNPPLVGHRYWRSGDFTDRFVFPKPVDCPRLEVYAATPETIYRIEQETHETPTTQTLKISTVEVPVRDHYRWEDITVASGRRYPFPPEFADFYLDPRVAYWTHHYYAADIYVQLLKGDPNTASRYYRLDRNCTLEHMDTLSLPDGIVVSTEGRIDHLKMFGGGVFNRLDSVKSPGRSNWSHTSLCEIHLQVEDYPYELY